VARTYSACCSGLDKNSLAECLAESDRTPTLYRAHARFSLARAIKSNERREEQDRLYALALKSFEDENHVHGVLDTEIAMTCRLPLDPDDRTFDERLRNLFKRYEALNYPTGLGDALLQLLDLAHGLNNFETGYLVLDDLESLFGASTSKLIWLMVRISALARWSMRVGDRGKIIQGGEALWNDLIGSDCALFRGQAAQLVSQAYNALKDREMMTIWSQRAQNDLSQTNLTAIPSLVAGFDLNNIEGLAQCYQMVSAMVNPELRDYSPEVAVEKIEVFLNQALVRTNQDARSWDIIDSAIKLYEENLSRTTDMRLASVPLAKLRQAQATMLTLRASSRQDIDLELAALKPLKEARDLFLKAKEIGQAVIVLQREALLNVGIAQKFERMRDPQAKLAWQTALNQYKIALDSANGLGLTFLAVGNAYLVAFCEYRQWTHGWCSPEALLQSLLVAESFVDRQRQEVSILRGMAAAVVKGRLSSDNHARNIYRFAIQVCISAGNVLDAWSWVQKSKARSLSDLLGLGVFIPLELTERIQQDTACRQLFEDEHRLAEDLAAAPDTERFKVRIKLERHQKTMREHAVLAELLDLREGVPIALDELFAGSTKDHTRNRRNQTTVFIDWVATESGFSMYVVKQGEKPILRNLPITIQTIHMWVSEHLNSGSDAANSTPRETALSGVQEEDEVDEGPLRDLDVLVAPLAEHSSPDDLLVLCPTGPLHAIPLHALRVGPIEDRQILIERNPIVYCASLTSFVQCCRRANSGTTAKVSKRLLAVYEQESGPENDDRKQFSDDERRQIYASTERLADNLNGESLCGENVTMQSFKESLECANFVHFFGHYDYTPDLIAEQSLRISGEGGAGGGEFNALPLQS
jgi:tetratricopeptide (TPR) repeat protein